MDTSNRRAECVHSRKSLIFDTARVMAWTVTAILLLFSQVGCKPKIDGIKYFSMATSVLKDVRQEWLKDPQSKNFEPSKVIGGSYSNVFFYTNAVQAEGKVYHCRFAVHDNILPPGILAICDDETVLWISDRNGQVVVDPEHKIIEEP